MQLNQAIEAMLGRANEAGEGSKLESILSQFDSLFDRASKGKRSGQSLEEADVFARLAIAAEAGQTEIFDELVKAERSDSADNEPTILMAAVMAGQSAVVDALIAAGADVNKKIKQIFSFSALELAVKDGKRDIVQSLLEAGADPNSENENPGFSLIVKAVKQSDIALVRLLLDYGAQVKFETDFKLLVEAAQQQDAEIVQLLLEAGCDANDSDHRGSALRVASSACNVEVMRVLTAAGAKVKGAGGCFLAILAAPFRAKQLSGLLGEQADPTSQIPAAFQVLLEAGVDPNAVGPDTVTPLSAAVSAGHLEVVEMLLAAGAAPNQIGKRWGLLSMSQPEYKSLVAQYALPTTPLVLAAAFGRLEIAQCLIEMGAVPDRADEAGVTPLKSAIREGHRDIVELLQSAGVNEADDLEVSVDDLLGAAKRGDVALAQAVLEAGIDPNSMERSPGRRRRDKTVLILAAEQGHLEMVKLLVASGADVDLSDRPGKRFGKTPLMYAADYGHSEVVKFLLSSGATVDAQDKRGQTALFYAVVSDTANPESVEALLKNGADPHKKNWDDTPFEIAAYVDGKIAKLVLEADRDNEDSPKRRAARAEMLDAAAYDGNAALVRSLIQEGIDVNQPAEEGDSTPLMTAAMAGKETIVQLLIAAGADVNKGSDSGETALIKAAYWGHIDVVKLLISAGADVNARTKSGWTALISTAVFGSAEVVTALLAAGADATLKNDDGQTLMAMARSAPRKHAIIETLRQAGIAE